MSRRTAAAAVLVLGAVLAALGCGLSASASPLESPSPAPTGGTSVSLTVDGTASPSPSPSTSAGAGGSTGGTQGGSAGGNSGGSTGGTTQPGGGAPACTPSTTTPPLSPAAAEHPSSLRLSASSAAQGTPLAVSATEFQPGEKVVIALYPNPVKLGVFTADRNGKLSARVTVPDSAPLGSHTVQAIGFQDCHVAAGPLTVVSPRGSGVSNFPWIVWAVAGGGVGVACLGMLIAFLFGWLPKGLVLGAAAGAVR